MPAKSDRIRKLLTTVILLCAGLQLHAEPTTSLTPTRLVLTWSADPARSQDVTWRTEQVLPGAQAQIVKLDANPDSLKTAATVTGSAVQDDLGGGKVAGHYRAKFDNLEPSTAYCYRVGDGKIWSEWNTFHTASATAAPFRFIYLGDAQNSIKSVWSRTVRTAHAAAPDARFIAFAGDLLAEGYDDGLWEEWTSALSFISATVPTLPVPGNHDLHRAPTAKDPEKVYSASPLWSHHFSLPTNGPDLPDLVGQSYYMDYQGVRFVCVDVNAFANDSFEASEKQRVQTALLGWLEKVLSENSNQWTIVIQHQPLFAVAKGRDYVEMREKLAPLYERHHVDLVLQGHDHSYTRSPKVTAGKVVAPSAPGVIYVISVSGPKMYDRKGMNADIMQHAVEHKQLYQIIDVANDKLTFASYAVSGTLEDKFELHRTGTTTTLIETH